MLSQSLQDSLNEQIKNEFYSAHVYLAMSSWFEDKGLPGFAKWMRVQYSEELSHGLKIFDFINDRDGRAQCWGLMRRRTTGLRRWTCLRVRTSTSKK